MIQISRLAYLMGLFSVKGKDLAQYVHVDTTLISKYRNNKRRLAPNSVLVREISEFFLLLDSASGHQTIKDILKTAYPEGNVRSTDTLRLLLNRWLAEGESPFQAVQTDRLEYSTHFTVYRGSKGRMQAAFRLIDLTLSLPEPGELSILALGDFSQRFQQEEFRERWLKGYTDILKQGHHISVINFINRDIPNLLSSLSLWLPYVLTGNVSYYYYTRFTLDLLKTNLVVLKDHAAIIGLSSPRLGEEPLAHFYTDLPTVQHHYQLFETIIESCNHLYHTCDASKPGDFLQALMDMENHPGDSLIYSALPFWGLNPDKLIKLLLVDNDLDIESILPQLYLMEEYGLRFRGNLEKYPCRYFFNVGEFQSAFAAADYVDPNLSMAFGAPIKINKNYLQHELMGLLMLMDNYPNFKVGLYSDTVENKFKGINIWTRRNWITLANNARPNENPFKAIYTKEATSNNAFYHYFDDLWNCIPPLERDNTYVKNKLYHLLH